MEIPTFKPEVEAWLKANRPGYIEDTEIALADYKIKDALFKLAKDPYDKCRKEVKAKVQAIFAEPEPEVTAEESDRYDRVYNLAWKMVSEQMNFEIVTGRKCSESQSLFSKIVRKIDPNFDAIGNKLEDLRLSREAKQLRMNKLALEHRDNHPEVVKAYEEAFAALKAASSKFCHRNDCLKKAADVAEIYLDPEAYLEKMRLEERQYLSDGED